MVVLPLARGTTRFTGSCLRAYRCSFIIPLRLELPLR